MLDFSFELAVLKCTVSDIAKGSHHDVRHVLKRAFDSAKKLSFICAEIIGHVKSRFNQMPDHPRTSYLRLLLHTKRHPSAILLLVQLLGMLLYPFIENTRAGHIGFNVFGIVVLGITIGMVRRTPGLVWISACLAGPIIVLLVLQMAFEMPALLPWSSGLEALFYFYAAGSLIAYMSEDRRATTDELFAAGATFTLLAWGFTHLFVLTQALQPGTFAAAIDPTAPR